MNDFSIPVKAPGDTLIVSISFLSRLAAGETLASASCTVSLLSGIDPSPNAILPSSSTVNGGTASQPLTGGVSGNIYQIACTGQTSGGQKITLYGKLVVL